MSYHAASGNIIVGLGGGHVEMWQTAPYIAPAFQVSFPVCFRERLAKAQVEVKNAEASIEKAYNGLRQQMSREQELKRSIADLEEKCALISNHVSIVLISDSGNREKGT